MKEAPGEQYYTLENINGCNYVFLLGLKLIHVFKKASGEQFHTVHHIDGLVQDCSNSIANALELLQSYSETAWAVGIAQLTHHEVQGGGKNPETVGRGIFAPAADRVVS